MDESSTDSKLQPTQQYAEDAVERARKLLDSLPEQVGPYRILERIGGGGMGEVFRAEQRHPIRRDVALKYIKRGMDTRAVIARFEAERQALALMDHPHIAKVFDAGTDETGRPFFVMEYVEGEPITDYADHNTLTIPQRLELVEQVCHAIQHAHQKGVIHRDLKPSNVLVSTHDGKPFAKVIDFGIAKAVGQQLTDKTLITMHSDFIGTPQYMSPEQAECSLDIDTRTDVYSLGVMLYELLTGSPPFSSAGLNVALWEQFRKQIVEVDPPRPSLRVNASGHALTSIASVRRTDPKRLGRLVSGELDWIVMKAIEKDRTRRYETPTDLAKDLRAYLVGDQVLAAPPSAMYLIQKFVRKNKGPVAATVFVVVTLIVGIVGTTYGLWRATEAEQSALQALDEKADALNAMNVALAEVSQERNAKTEALVGEQSQRTIAEENLKLADRRLYHAEINLAQFKWASSQVGPILRTLAKYRPNATTQAVWHDQRGFEYFYLEKLTDHSCLTLSGHNWSVACVAFSADGRQIASASHDRTIKVWDAATGQETLTISGHDGRVSSIAYSPDDKQFASGSADRTVKIWSRNSGEEVLALEGHTDAVSSVAFSPSGRQLASASADRTVRLWDVDTGKEVLALRGHNGAVTSVAYSPDGRQIASASWDGTVKVWDAASGVESFTLRGHKYGVLGVCFSPDGQKVASASWDSTVKQWNATTGQLLLTFDGHFSFAYCVAFSPDGSRVASSGLDDTIRVWDAMTGDEVLTLKGHTMGIASVAFAPDGWRLASASEDSTIKVWDTTRKQESLSLNGHTNWVRSVTISADGQRVASGSLDRTIKVWNTVTGQESTSLEGHSAGVQSVVFSPDGMRAASASDDRTIKIWDVTTGQNLLTLEGHGDVVHAVAFSPDGERLASASRDSTIKEWDAGTGQEIQTLKRHSSAVNSVVYSPDGMRLASGSGDRTIKIWDVRAGHELHTLEGHGASVNSVCFSPDGRKLASASSDFAIKVWDAERGQELLTLNGHSYWVLAVVFSPDGRRVASGSGDGTIKIWDAETGQESLTFNEHSGTVSAVAFSRDGMMLASANEDKTVRMWDARPWTPERRIEQTALGVVRHLVENRKVTRRGVMDRIARDPLLTPEQREKSLSIAKIWRIPDDAEAALEAWKQLASSNTENSYLSLRVAALCAWNKWHDELAGIRSDSIARGEGTSQADAVERYAKICVFSENVDRSQLEGARKIVKSVIEKEPNHPYSHYFHLVLGMAEYRLGEYESSLRECELLTKNGVGTYAVPVTAALYRAMSLCRLGRVDEARTWHSKALEKMRPIPEPDQNPLANDAVPGDVFAWLASQECAALLMSEP